MKKILFILLALILVSCAPLQRVALPTPAPITQRMLFPLYVYPGVNGAAWQAVTDANIYGNIDAIVNPANGPGLNKGVNYTNGINKLRAGNVGVYGYVHSSYGARDIALVKADVDRWLEWYSPLVGIFVDEAEYRPGQGDEGYYSELYAYISGKGLKVVNNPGTGTIETYANLADTTCIFEGAVTKSFTFPSWGWSYPPSKFCYLAYAASVEQMRAAVAMAKVNNIGYFYATNADSNNAWNQIPSYLAEEAALLAGGTVPPTIIPATPSRTPTVTATRTPAPVTASQTPILITSTPTRTPTRTPTASIPATAVCEEALSVWVCDKYPYP